MKSRTTAQFSQRANRIRAYPNKVRRRGLGIIRVSATRAGGFRSSSCVYSSRTLREQPPSSKDVSVNQAQFCKLFADLPEPVQEQTRAAYRQFKEDPSHPSLTPTPITRSLPLTNSPTQVHLRGLRFCSRDFNRPSPIANNNNFRSM